MLLLACLWLVSGQKVLGGCAWAEALKKKVPAADKGKQKGILERDRPT